MPTEKQGASPLIEKQRSPTRDDGIRQEMMGSDER